MVIVGQILQAKGTQVWSAGPEDTVYEALQIMAEKGIGALLVMEADSLAGIFSERDYARKIALAGKSSMDTPVRDVMTKEVVCITRQHTTVECMEIMTEKRFRHLPVKEAEKVIGLISIGDVVKAIISDQEFTIKQLENYITGER
jgi:CBS domain-containing protein